MEIVVVIGVISLLILSLYSMSEEGQSPIIEKPKFDESNKSGFGGLLLLVAILLFVFGFFGFGASESVIDSAVSFVLVVFGISVVGLLLFTEKIMPRFGLILFFACIVSIFFVIASIGGL